MVIIAIQVNYTDPETQVNSPVAYARILGMTVDADAQTVDLKVGVYAASTARFSGGIPFTIFHAWPGYSDFLGQTINVRTAAYNFLKALPQFTNAIDVIETPLPITATEQVTLTESAATT